MKTIFRLVTIIFCFFLLTGCSKGDVVTITKEEQIAKLLTGDGNKVWHLRKVFQNNVEQTLSSSQMKYNKTYTMGPGETKRGRFTNYDNYTGTWFVRSDIELREEFDNNTPVGFFIIDYIINNLTSDMLDIRYTQNGVQTREVYYAN